MTPKQQRFCQEYLIDLCATKAAIRAGYSAKTANRIGNQNLSKLDISTRIKELRSEQSIRTELNGDQVLQALGKIAYLDPRRMYKEDGTPIDIKDLPEDVAAAIAGFEFSESGYKWRFSDRIKALELLGRHFGLFPTTQDVRVEARVANVGQVVVYLPDNGRD